MRFGKLAASLPSAVLVGVVVHIAAAGFEHAPGGRNAVPLAVGLAVLLLGSLAVAFGRGAFGRAHHSITTPGELVYATLALAFAGTASYGAIELLEGHVGLGGAVRALLASFPVAALVLALSRTAKAAATDAGTRLVTLLRVRRDRRDPHPRFVWFVEPRRVARSKRERRPHAGRAPPI